MSCLMRGAIALACFTLVGCDKLTALNPFDGPPKGLLANCVVMPTGANRLAPWSVVVDTLKERGWTLHWERDGNTTILRADVSDALDGQRHTMALRIEDDGPTDAKQCGPRRAKVTRLLLDKEELGPQAVDDNLTNLIGDRLAAAANAEAAAIARAAASRPSPPPLSNMSAAAPPQADSAAEAPSNAQDAAAPLDDANSGGNAPVPTSTADPQLLRPIRIDDGNHLYCCLTVSQVIDHFRAKGLVVHYKVVQDSGDVLVFLKALDVPGEQKSDVTLGFGTFPEYPGQLVLAQMFQGGRPTDPPLTKLAAFLRDEFPLHQRPR